MTERDFSYWLQGFFELSTKPLSTNFTDDQRDCIRRHLELVDHTEKAPSKLCIWIWGALDGGASVDVVKARLAKHFQHVIDPQAPGDQGILNHIHGSDTLYRC